MLEALVVILAIATMVLGALVSMLFQETKQLRSDLELRLQAIEQLEGPFARKLAEAGPAPLKRVLALNVKVFSKFWKDVLHLTPAQVEEVKVHLHNIRKDASAEVFDHCFFEVRIRIEEWRGGFTHCEVEYPSSPLLQPRSRSRYDGGRGEGFWHFNIPPYEGDRRSGGTLQLETNGRIVTLNATGGRFGYVSSVDTGPAPENVFLAIPLTEGPSAERYFKPAFRVDFAPECTRCLRPWERYYQHLDVDKGLAWDLWIDDCDLRTRTEGNETTASAQMLADWRERFAWNEEGKSWHERVSNAIQERERWESNRFSMGTEEDADGALEPDMTEQG
jgi:hypothetical protein